MRDAADRLRAAAIDNPRLDARVLWEHAKNSYPPLEGGSKSAQQISGRGRAQTSTSYPSPKNPSDFSTLPQGEGGIAERFESFIVRRIAREPVAYITGRKEFWSLDFAVGPGALIPRPESETSIEQVLKHFPDRDAALDVLDLGTGTGCLLVACLSEYANARGTGIDGSARALDWARRNVENHRAKAALQEADFTGARGAHDVILSNPPYIRHADIPALAPDVRLYEPIGALDGGADGLEAYRTLGPGLARLLKPKGLAFLEIGVGQGEAVATILGENGLKIRAIAQDLAGIGRCIIAGR